jgi:hypothetical protein
MTLTRETFGQTEAIVRSQVAIVPASVLTRSDEDYVCNSAALRPNHISLYRPARPQETRVFWRNDEGWPNTLDRKGAVGERAGAFGRASTIAASLRSAATKLFRSFAEYYLPDIRLDLGVMVLNLSVMVRVFFRPQLPPSRIKGVEGEKKCWGWPVL